MKNSLKPIGIILAVLVGLIGIVFWIAPGAVDKDLSIKIYAPKKLAFDQINDFTKWNKWWHWSSKDSIYETKTGDTIIGLGAKCFWEKNQGVLTKNMRIIKSYPSQELAIQLTTKNNGAIAQLNFLFKETKEGHTLLECHIKDKNTNPFKRLFYLITSDSLLCSSDLATSLGQLKQICETTQHKCSPAKAVTVQKMRIISKTIHTSYAQINQKLQPACLSLMEALKGNRKKPTGPLMCIRKSFTDPNNLEIELAIPVKDSLNLPEGLKNSVLSASKSVMVTHYGPNSLINESYKIAQKYIIDSGLTKHGDPWECYLSANLINNGSQENLTHIFIPIE